jgi:hypothetical protein
MLYYTIYSLPLQEFFVRFAPYHQHNVLYLIKPQDNTRWRVMRYKGGLPPLMIYRSYGTG